MNWLNGFEEKNPAKIVKVADTLVNGNACTHLIANTRDTMVKGEHFYTRIHLLINKKLGVPERIMIKARNADVADAIGNYYTETSYSDYRFNQDHISADDQPVPPGFHPPKAYSTPLLTVGSVAPDWTLTAANGEKVSLTQLKGKVVVIDYFFIGCYGCMLSLKPLNALHQKYQHQNVGLVSVTERDNKKSVAAFRIKYNINYPIYTNGADMVKAYHIESFPTFYVIDQQGKIAGTIVGYSDDFESKISAMIDALVKN